MAFVDVQHPFHRCAVRLERAAQARAVHQWHVMDLGYAGDASGVPRYSGFGAMDVLDESFDR